LLELKIVVLDAPAQLRVIDHATKADVIGKNRETTGSPRNSRDPPRSSQRRCVRSVS
jgi:hypothetical protein